MDLVLGKGETVKPIDETYLAWVKEQKEVTEDYVRQNLRSLHFIRGQKFMAIPKWDKTALEFARICRHNVGSPNNKTGSKWEFFEYNPQKQAEEALKNEMFEIEMITKAQQQTEDFMRKHASYLGIGLVDSFGFPKPADAIRREYIVYAKHNPKQFANTISSKEVEVSFLVRKALSEQLIDLGSVRGTAVWAKNMATICRLPPTGNPIEHLTALALTNSNEGRDFLQGLQVVA